jgi:hypothetical protein
MKNRAREMFKWLWSWELNPLVKWAMWIVIAIIVHNWILH